MELKRRGERVVRGVKRSVEGAEGFGMGWQGGVTFDVTKLVERQKRKES